MASWQLCVLMASWQLCLCVNGILAVMYVLKASWQLCMCVLMASWQLCMCVLMTSCTLSMYVLVTNLIDDIIRFAEQSLPELVGSLMRLIAIDTGHLCDVV